MAEREGRAAHPCRGVPGCCLGRHTDQLTAADDPAVHAPPTRTRITRPLAPPASVPSSQFLPLVERIESVAGDPIKEEFFNGISPYFSVSASPRVTAVEVVLCAIYYKKLPSDGPNSTIRRAAQHPKPRVACPKLRLRTAPATPLHAVLQACGRAADMPSHIRGVLRSLPLARLKARARP